MVRNKAFLQNSCWCLDVRAAGQLVTRHTKADTPVFNALDLATDVDDTNLQFVNRRQVVREGKGGGVVEADAVLALGLAAEAGEGGELASAVVEGDFAAKEVVGAVGKQVVGAVGEQVVGTVAKEIIGSVAEKVIAEATKEVVRTVAKGRIVVGEEGTEKDQDCRFIGLESARSGNDFLSRNLVGQGCRRMEQVGRGRSRQNEREEGHERDEHRGGSKDYVGCHASESLYAG